jgi:hypothetical protein
MRGTDPERFVHVTELGDPRVLSFGYYARSEDDLKALTKLEGATGLLTRIARSLLRRANGICKIVRLTKSIRA